MTTQQAELEAAAAELDALIADETVRARHVRLVRVRAAVERLLGNVDNPPRTDGLDNLITPAGADGA